MSQQNSPNRRVKSVDKTCEILEALLKSGETGVTELAQETGHSKATVHSHLTTLLDNEFVTKHDNKYRVGLKFEDFGEHAKRSIPAFDIIKEEVNRLAEETGEMAHFLTEEHGRGVYVHKARGESAIRTGSYIGYRKDLHATAVGKATMSQLSDQRVGEIIDEHGLSSHTENTITSEEELFEELETIRERQLAFDEGEALPGLRCVAAPVDCAHDGIKGAISISGPTSRFNGDHIREHLAELVRDAASVIRVNSTQV